VSAAKQKGTAWETALVNTLGGFFGGRYGLAPRRVAQEGFLDTGDIHGISPFIAQAKNYKSWEDAIRIGLDGAEVQKVRAGEPFGVAFVKRVRKGVGAGYAVMNVETWARLLARLKSAEYHLERSAPGAWETHISGVSQDALRSF
jgi:hypothetical protein